MKHYISFFLIFSFLFLNAQIKDSLDTDKDGVLDKDDSCPNLVGIIEFGGCPNPYNDNYTQKELDSVKTKFIENVKNSNYHNLAEKIFKRIRTIIYDKKGSFQKKKIVLNTTVNGQVVCGLDNHDYAKDDLLQSLKEEYFWDEENLKKFVSLFPDKYIMILPKIIENPQNEYERKINTKLENLPKSKINDTYVYNIKANFNDLKSLKNLEKDYAWIYLEMDLTEDKAEIEINVKNPENLTIVEVYEYEYKNSKWKETMKHEYKK